MAMHALSTVAPALNSAPNTTRRDLLRFGTSAAAYAAGAVIVTGGVALASEAKGAELARFEWEALVKAYRAARTEELRLLNVFEERQGLWFAARQQREPEPVAPSPGPIDKSLSLTAIIAQTDAPAWKTRWADYEAARKAWQARHDADRAAFMGDREARFTAGSDACDDAFAKVKGYPVTSIAMLNEKAAVMTERYAGDFEGHDAEQLMRDIARLAQEGR